MKTPKILIALSAATLAVAVASGSALAHRGGGNPERMIERVAERLELDDGQRAALETLAEELAETRTLMRGDGGELRAELRDLVTAESFDQAAALSLIESRAAALQAQAPEVVAAAATFLDGLTPEQKADVERFLDRAERRHGRHGRHGDR